MSQFISTCVFSRLSTGVPDSTGVLSEIQLQLQKRYNVGIQYCTVQR
jgi:hypothetical protein